MRVVRKLLVLGLLCAGTSAVYVQDVPGGPRLVTPPDRIVLPPQPELAKKINKMLALREMLRIGLTANDIETALPMLRSLREAEKRLQSRSEQLLDQEIAHLLAASPGQPPREDVMQQLHRANEDFRQAENEAWRAVGTSIGWDKSNGLRRLVSGPPRVANPPGPPPDQPVGGPGPDPGFMDEPVSSPPGGGGWIDPMPGAEPGPTVQLQPGGRLERVPGQQGSRVAPQGVGGAAQPQIVPLVQPRLTLGELIELLEQKLAAIKRRG